ncbi:proteinase [Pochonia chlamydosporia 170]|uniref:Proteinase n=1 Tax=Pochonia chlamydosporia 170 TaxID=1380566 RepID=A0A179FRK6_METCM|nr:proteinase [Pochonia chlamydosporia 170]OAQ67723.1 proteinase [Pochonia chlamydosporia 170]
MCPFIKFLPLLRPAIELTCSTERFDWTSIKPSTNLEYHPCYTNAQCARLILPLDYQKPNDTRTVALAIAKIPTTVPDDDPRFGGSIFLNPGGPGGCATDLAVWLGPSLQLRLERSGRRHYEYIGIDGRGIGHSWPASNCFPGDLLSRLAFNMEQRGMGSLTDSDHAIRYGLALSDGFGERCAMADKSGLNGGDIMAYAGTASVARDMVEVADKIVELRLRRHGANGQYGGDAAQTTKDVARIQYLGFSYGTILGHYLVSMFPERVGRLILDGVMDPRDYATGPGWTTNLADTDKLYHAFFGGCHKAGPSICALSRSGDKSGNDIESRFNTWFNKLEKDPLTSIGPDGDVRILTGCDIRAYMGGGFYAPIATFQTMAFILDAAITGNTARLFDAYFSDISPKRKADGGLYDDPLHPAAGDGGYAVRCGDGDDVTQKDVTWWREYAQNLTSRSLIFGSYWANKRFICSGWKFKSNWRFTGPFTSPEPRKDASGDPEPGYPAAPTLYLSTRLDHVTPLLSARDMRDVYPGAGLGVLDVGGHTTLGAGATSECIEKLVEEYLETGTVPAEESVCTVDCGPWDEKCEVEYTI